MYRIGLTGGIAAGKSTVAQRFAQLGAVVIDHDVLAREAVAVGSEGLQQVVAEFGASVLAADGSLDRPALGQMVFGNAEQLAKLNAIVHPQVYRLSEQAEAAAGKEAVVVHDIPLLVETGQHADFDVLVVVDTPPEVRVDRLVRLRGMSEADARARIAAQIDDERRRAVADVVLNGAAPMQDLLQQVDELWRGLDIA